MYPCRFWQARWSCTKYGWRILGYTILRSPCWVGWKLNWSIHGPRKDPGHAILELPCRSGHELVEILRLPWKACWRWISLLVLKEWPCVADVTWSPKVKSTLITRAGYSRDVSYESCTCPLGMVGSCKWCAIVAAQLSCLLVPYWIAVSGVGDAAQLPLLAGLSDSAKMESASASK